MYFKQETYFASLVHLQCMWNGQQWRSQNAEKVKHIKGGLLYQAIILYNYIPFLNGNFS